MKKILFRKAAHVFLIIVMYGTTLSFAQSSSAKLLPTGRSLPDDIPRSEFVYVGPADQATEEEVIEPQIFLQPTLDPDGSVIPELADKDELFDTLEFPKTIDSTPPNKVVSTYPLNEPVFMPKQDPVIAIEPELEDIPETKTVIDDGPAPTGTPPPSGTPPPTGQADSEPFGASIETEPTDTGIEPKDSPNINPYGIPEFSPNGLSIPPSGSADTEPNKSALLEPSQDGEFEPDSDALMEPSGSAIELVPRGDALIGLDEQPTEDKLGPQTRKWKFTLSPTQNQYTEPDDEEEKQADTRAFVYEEPKEVAAEVVRKPEVPLTDIIRSLNGNRYIQISSYHSLDYAKNLLGETRDKLGELLGNKTVIYKAEESKYYKLVVGPFPLSEIGVNLYKLRKLGFSDAYTIK